jgi:hypothetical protein
MVTLGLLSVIVTVQVLGPVAVTELVVVQLLDHPPNVTPDCCGAVKVTVVPMG